MNQQDMTLMAHLLRRAGFGATHDELEVAVAQVCDVRQIAGQEVIDTDDRMPAIEECFAEMGADEAGGAGDDGSHTRWKRPRKTVSHMIFRSRVTDQFSM